MSIEILTQRGMSWINVENPTPDDLGLLRDRFRFHPLELDNIRSKNSRPKLHAHEEYIALVLHFPLLDPERHVTASGEVGVFLGPNYLVTVHEGRFKPLVRFFEDCRGNEDLALRNLAVGPGHLFFGIMKRLADYCFPILNRMGTEVREGEKELAQGVTRGLADRIRNLQTELCTLRRILKPQMAVLRRLPRQRSALLSKDLTVYLSDISDTFHRIWDTLEYYRELLVTLQRHLFALEANRSALAMRQLAILALIFWPLQLLLTIFIATTVVGLSALLIVLALIVTFALAGVALLVRYRLLS